MERMLTLIAIFVLMSSNAQASCLNYADITTLTGKISVRVMPGPPNYQSVASGDVAETVLFINLKAPVCVDAYTLVDPLVNVDVDDVSKIQMAADHDLYSTMAHMSGRRVQIKGKLFGRISGHHRTPVLIDVKSMKPLT